MRVGRRLAAFGAGLAIALVACVGSPGAQAQTFTFNGADQTFTVPAGETLLHVLAIGGSGGASGAAGGAGARVTAELRVSPGQLLYVEPASNGQAQSGVGGDGGGASDLRTSPLAAGLVPDPRLIVAGGGGGGGTGATGTGGAAGAKGADSGGGLGGAPGTSSQGGAGGSPNGQSGSLGLGGTGGGIGGGGGGGGYYGGGGGGDALMGGAGGGGGSNFVTSAARNPVIAADTTRAPLVEITPSSLFGLGRLKLHRKSGTATLSVNVPGPGKVSLSGNGVVRRGIGRGTPEPLGS